MEDRLEIAALREVAQKLQAANQELLVQNGKLEAQLHEAARDRDLLERRLRFMQRDI